MHFVVHRKDIKNKFNILPNEIILNVFQKMDLKCLIDMSQTCKKYYNLFKNYIYDLEINFFVLKLIDNIVYYENSLTCEDFIYLENLYEKFIFNKSKNEQKYVKILKYPFPYVDICKKYSKKHILLLNFWIKDIDFKIYFINENDTDLYRINYNYKDVIHIKIEDVKKILVFLDEHFKENQSLDNLPTFNKVFTLEKTK